MCKVNGLASIARTYSRRAAGVRVNKMATTATCPHVKEPFAFHSMSDIKRIILNLLSCSPQHAREMIHTYCRHTADHNGTSSVAVSGTPYPPSLPRPPTPLPTPPHPYQPPRQQQYKRNATVGRKLNNHDNNLLLPWYCILVLYTVYTCRRGDGTHCTHTTLLSPLKRSQAREQASIPKSSRANKQASKQASKQATRKTGSTPVRRPQPCLPSRSDP